MEVVQSKIQFEEITTMKKPSNVTFSRRTFVAGALAAGGAAITGCKSKTTETTNETTSMTKSDLYSKGSLDIQKTKDAYFKMLADFNYPIPDILKTDDFWVCDFEQGDILALGMSGIFWINEKGEYKSSGAGNYSGDYADQSFGYLLHEIYLLPGQTLPEHNHLGGPENMGPKMESWQVRYGEVYFFGQYKHGDELLISEAPENMRPWGFGEDWFKSKYISKRDAKTNQMYTLKDPEAWHGQKAGPKGAIVTEVATFHNHVQFSKPGMKFNNTGH